MNSLRLLIASCLFLAPGFVEVAPAQEELVDLVTGLLGDKDKELRSLAFDQIRKEAKGEAATKKFAELLTKFPAETQIGLLSALADRGDAAAAPAVRDLLAAEKNEAVRTAAIKALGPLGGTEDLPLLLETLAANSVPLREAARDSLIRLPNEASAGMIAALPNAPAATRAALLPILTVRRVREAIPAVLTSAGDSDAAVRQAALAALAELADANDVPALLPFLHQAAAGRERDAVEKTIATICLRHPDKPERAAPLLAALAQANAAERLTLLSAIGRVGGAKALQVTDEALESTDAAERAAGLRALGNWPDGSVITRLLRIARTDADPEQRKAAFQALVRIAPLADDRDERRRLDALRTVFVMCGNDAERNQVLDRAKAIRHIDTLNFLLPYLDQPKYAQQACLTVVELAHHSSLRESNKDAFTITLNRVKEISRDPVVVDRAERYLTGQTWVRPKNAEKAD